MCGHSQSGHNLELCGHHLPWPQGIKIIAKAVATKHQKHTKVVATSIRVIPKVAATRHPNHTDSRGHKHQNHTKNCGHKAPNAYQKPWPLGSESRRKSWPQASESHQKPWPQSIEVAPTAVATSSKSRSHKL
eukprot:TRINITY_DN16286_c0_g4_i1.p2 TRINITY_DN16286_c0_g4~~TRINITY_DN16286_c0_g4_i1.p2  ORF type:complete len:132 (-),score=8.39 TRINITY_DN16286_c0_g4_i1:109-504(-)